MKSLILGATFIWMLCSFSPLFAQDDYNPEFLIPYNDHGKWGYCDTLGNIKVTPQFESADFVSSNQWFHYSYVQRDDQKIYYIVNKGVVAPVGHNADYSFFKRFLAVNNLSVIVKNGKKGLFDYAKQSIIVPVEFDEVELDPNQNRIYFLKGEDPKKRTAIMMFDLYTMKFEKQNFVELRSVIVEEDADEVRIILLRSNRNKWFAAIDGEWHEYSFSESNFLDYSSEDTREVAMNETVLPQFGKREFFWFENPKDGTLHSSIHIPYTNDFKVLYKSGKFGLNRNETSVLPFEYDYIDINYFEGCLYLLKDKKMGVYLPQKSLPMITPKYDFITFNRKFQISKYQEFTVFEVQMNGNKGYVGENGVEYFNFN